MDEQLARRLGNVEVVFKEALDGKERLLIERIYGALLENFLQEKLTARKLLGNALIVLGIVLTLTLSF